MRYLLHIYTCCALLAVASCKKLIDVGPPRTETTSANTFNDTKTATAALMGIYTRLEGARTAHNTTQPGLSADELTSYSSPVSPYYTNSLNAALNNEFWSNFYSHIYQSNNLIENVQRSTGIKENDKRQLTGEALFLRAFCYFYLVNYFGDVPYITSTDYASNSLVKRMSAKDTVYPAIINDLLQARDLLAPEYPTAQRVRVNKAAAAAMLARVYLYTGDWVNAEKYASEVIGNPDYTIEGLTTAFRSASREAIWQFSPNMPSLPYTNEAYLYILRGVPASSPGRSSISNFLLNAFETGDQRRTNWIGSITPAGGSTTYYYAWKYKTNTATGPQEFSIVLRLAEQYLIRAEARAMQDKNDLAADDVDVIRQRAGLGKLPDNLTRQECLNRIMQERRVELFVEWGHRWLDLKRTGLVNTVMPAVCQVKGGTWDPDWALYPIPQVQLLNDPNMTNDQNPGY